MNCPYEKSRPSVAFCVSPTYLQEVLQKAYIKAIVLASGETNLPMKTFPQDCPYTVEDILSDGFFPGSPATDEMMEY